MPRTRPEKKMIQQPATLGQVNQVKADVLVSATVAQQAANTATLASQAATANQSSINDLPDLVVLFNNEILP